MSIVWITKRHYTHKDALKERFGRVYELPLAWSRMGNTVSLEFVDYYGHILASNRDENLDIFSTPVRNLPALLAMRRRIITHRPEIIIASGDCFIGLLALRLARRTGALFVFDVYDDYRQFGANRLFAGLPAFEFLLRRAELVLYASQALASAHSANTPWILVPNGVDPAMFHPGSCKAARAAVGLANTDERWVGYFGGLETERGSEDLVAAVGILHAHDPSIRLVLCGRPIAGMNLRAPWVELRGSVPHAAIPDYINACDVVTLPYRRGPMIDMASSVKIAEYLYCRRPVVATRTPNFIANFPTQAVQLGDAICAPGDVADIARAINAQLRTPIIASEPREHAWQGIAEKTLATLRNMTRVTA